MANPTGKGGFIGGGKSANPKGRPKGALGKIGKLTEQQRQAMAERHSITPLDFLLSVVRDDAADLDCRILAAKAAAPYMHRKMPVAIEGGDENRPMRFDTKALENLS